jgi:hypothetical protein
VTGGFIVLCKRYGDRDFSVVTSRDVLSRG